MRRLRLSILIIACSLMSAATGYWVGFGNGMDYGVSADYVPRGATAVSTLNALRTGDQSKAISILELDIDNGLAFGFDIFQHPLRNLVGPLWGMDYSSDLEKLVVRMADYRKDHPSQRGAGAFNRIPPHIDKQKAMVERYGKTK